MKLGLRKGGTSTSFVDTDSGEMLLQFSWNADSSSQIAYHIYDRRGALVADSGGVIPVRAMSIVSAGDELLLDIPADIEQHIRYRLYNREGRLLTCSDGARTQIFAFLRMEPNRVWQSQAG